MHWMQWGISEEQPKKRMNKLSDNNLLVQARPSKKWPEEQRHSLPEGDAPPEQAVQEPSLEQEVHKECRFEQAIVDKLNVWNIKYKCRIPRLRIGQKDRGSLFLKE